MSDRPPLFLERDTYRYRRAIDAARLLPVLGVLLWLIPVFWAQTDGAETSMSQAMIYIFIVWLGLIVLCAFVSSRIAKRSYDSFAEPPAKSTTDPAIDTTRPDSGS